MQRFLLGLIAAAFLVGGIVLFYSGLPEYWSVSMAGIAVRASFVLGALWLALPQVRSLLERLTPAVVIAAGVAGLILTIRPRLLTYAIPLLLVILVLHWLGRLAKPRSQIRKKRSIRSPKERAPNGRAV